MLDDSATVDRIEEKNIVAYFDQDLLFCLEAKTDRSVSMLPSE